MECHVAWLNGLTKCITSKWRGRSSNQTFKQCCWRLTGQGMCWVPTVTASLVQVLQVTTLQITSNHSVPMFCRPYDTMEEVIGMRVLCAVIVTLLHCYT
jgi:hypothetical protein